MGNKGYDFARASAAVRDGTVDLVSFATLFLANPDLPERFRRGAALTRPTGRLSMAAAQKATPIIRRWPTDGFSAASNSQPRRQVAEILCCDVDRHRRLLLATVGAGFVRARDVGGCKAEPGGGF